MLLSKHALSCSESLGKYCFLFVTYASNDEIARRDLWTELRTMDASMPPTPWIDVGNFNVVHEMAECSDYFQGMPIPSKVQEFQYCVGEIGFVNMPGLGPTFTWSNKRT